MALPRLLPEKSGAPATTDSILFAVYAPAGIPVSAVRAHLQDIGDHVQLVSPTAAVETLQVHGTGGLASPV